MALVIPWDWDDETHIRWEPRGDLPQAPRIGPPEVRQVPQVWPALDGVALRPEGLRLVQMPEGAWRLLGWEVPG